MLAQSQEDQPSAVLGADYSEPGDSWLKAFNEQADGAGYHLINAATLGVGGYLLDRFGLANRVDKGSEAFKFGESLDTAVALITLRPAKILSVGWRGLTKGYGLVADGVSLTARKVYRISEAVGEGVGSALVRLRHFTNSRGLRGINNDGVLRASDRGRVFTVAAKGKPLSPRDTEEALKIGRGRGNNYLEFDAHPSEFEVVRNPDNKAVERNFRGDVDLEGRNPSFHRNR